MGMHITPRNQRAGTKKVLVVDQSGRPRGDGSMERGGGGEEARGGSEINGKRLRGIRREFRGGSFSSSLGPFSCEIGHAWHDGFYIKRISPRFITSTAPITLDLVALVSSSHEEKDLTDPR